MTNLTDHFTLQEMTFSQTASRMGLDNTPSPAAIENLTRLCLLLERVRAVCGRPVTISSGYRSAEVNKAVGSHAEHSQHIQGCAADLVIKGMALDDIIKAVMDAKLPYDQMIREFDDNKGGGWVHISVPSFPWSQPRKEVLIIDRKGARPWIYSE